MVVCRCNLLPRKTHGISSIRTIERFSELRLWVRRLEEPSMSIVLDVMEDAVAVETQTCGQMETAGRGDGNGEVGEQIGKVLLELLGATRYDMWFDRKARLTVAGRALIVEAPNTFSANWIRGKFAAELRDAATRVLGREGTGVEVSVRVGQDVMQEVPRGGEWVKPEDVQPRDLKTRGETAAASAMAHNSAPINPRYTLEEFVVGPSNQMAYHAALRVAENPGQQFNPLFFHGNCGLGKTHLLQGICQRFAKLHPTKKWLYVTGEQFTNEFLEAIKTHKTDAFRRRIRSADLLVIDDVHFLANKKATQEEFLHTFNQIDASGKQIVLASDCAPKQIQSLSEQLSSRFVSGMVLRVDSPDLPTRLEILRRKVLRNGWNVSDAVLMHIAQSTSASVRELEGLLLQVVAGIRLINVGAPEASTVIASIKDRTAMRGPVPADAIVAATAEHFGLAPTTLLGSGREKMVSLARAVAMYLARQHTGMSYPEIGRAIGGKNHSTVIAACQRVEGLLLSGQLLCWTTPEGPRHQAMADAVHELEAAIRRRK
jgi:chromosomal replication initiator protein